MNDLVVLVLLAASGAALVVGFGQWQCRRKDKSPRAEDIRHGDRAANRAAPWPETIRERDKVWKNTATPGPRPSENELRSSPVEVVIHDLGRENNTEARRAAAERACSLGSDGRRAIPALLRAAVDVDETVRQSAFAALMAIDTEWPGKVDISPALPCVLKAFLTGRSAISEPAARILRKLGPSAVPALTEALTRATTAGDQVYLSRALGWIGPDSASAVPQLIACLRSEHPQSRVAATEALARIGPQALTALPALTAALGDDYAEVRLASASCLVGFGPAIEPAMPKLLSLLLDRDDKVREAACAALVQIGEAAVMPLAEIVRTRSNQRCAAQLRAERQVIEAALPSEVVLQLDPLRAYRNWSWSNYDALQQLYAVEAAQQAAVTVLGKIGAAAATAIPDLRAAMTDSNQQLRLCAAKALGQIASSV